MTTIDKGTCKINRNNNVVTITVVCMTQLEARQMFHTLVQSIRKDNRIEMLFSDTTNERYQGKPLQ